MQPVLPTSIQGSSIWHQMDSRWKLAGILLTVLLLVWLRTIPGTLLCFGLCIVFLLWARLPIRWWLDRLTGVGLFLFMVVCLLPLSMQPVSWSWGYLQISQEGLTLAIVILFKALAATSLALLLFGTAPIETTLHAASALHTPQPILSILLVCWRYVGVMYQVVQEFRIALRLRGFRNQASWKIYRTISQVIGTMLVLGFERAERVAQAMRCRGYQGRIMTLEAFQTRWIDPILFGCLVMSASAGMIVDHWLKQVA